jgi:hypothetical protein
MKWLRLCVILMIFVIPITFASSSYTHVIKPDPQRASVDFTQDFKRLAILQKKFQESTNAVDRFNYSAAMVQYTKRILERLQEVNDVYYVPAMLILTGELKDPRKNNQN